MTTMVSRSLVFVRGARTFRRCARFAHLVRWSVNARIGRDQVDGRRLRTLIGVEALLGLVALEPIASTGAGIPESCTPTFSSSPKTCASIAGAFVCHPHQAESGIASGVVDLIGFPRCQ